MMAGGIIEQNEVEVIEFLSGKVVDEGLEVRSGHGAMGSEIAFGGGRGDQAVTPKGGIFDLAESHGFDPFEG